MTGTPNYTTGKNGAKTYGDILLWMKLFIQLNMHNAQLKEGLSVAEQRSISYCYWLGVRPNSLDQTSTIYGTRIIMGQGASLANHPIPVSFKAMWQRIEYWQPSTSHPRSGSRCGRRTYGSVLGEKMMWKKFGKMKGRNNIRS